MVGGANADAVDVGVHFIEHYAVVFKFRKAADVLHQKFASVVAVAISRIAFIDVAKGYYICVVAVKDGVH